MKKKNRDALKGLKESLEQHRKETTYGAVEVDVDELDTLLRWMQNKAHHYFVGDRVKSTGASTPYGWVHEDGVQGTVYAESDERSITWVEWDNAPEESRRVEMYHNEIRLA